MYQPVSAVIYPLKAVLGLLGLLGVVLEVKADSPLFDEAPKSPTSSPKPASESQLFDESITPVKPSKPASKAEVSKQSGQFVFNGKLGAEYRYFPWYGLQDTQDYNNNASLWLQPTVGYQWNKSSLSFTPFGRWDEHDSNRTHYDVRELIYKTFGENWYLQIGIGKVFWGVTESRHTVDIINQTDYVENPDGERKLGQPMINFSYRTDYGVIDAFLLPVSRKRTFPGVKGRIRPTAIPMDERSPVYRGGASQTHTDFALRWSKSLGSFDVGLSYFRGTTREPWWLPSYLPGKSEPSRLLPVYDLIQQTSIDSAWALGSWLLKLEAYYRSGQGPGYAQVTTGFEYTFSGVFETGADLGLLAEYLYDGRREEYRVIPYQDSFFFGTRVAANDTGATEVIAGFFMDRNTSTIGYSVEASRRFGENWKLNFEARGFANTQLPDIAFYFRRENYFMLELERYF